MNLDSILSEDTGASQVKSGVATPALLSNDTYAQMQSHCNVRSYSTTQTFHSCPREYELYKLKSATKQSDRESNVTFAFGHSVGAGVATYDATQDLAKSIWSAFLAWDVDLLDEEIKTRAGREYKTGKSFAEAVFALELYQEFYHSETDLADYDVIKNEATVGVDFEDGHFYTGHIDTLLCNKYNSRYRIKENKTTSFQSIDPALYGNSDQALSYAVVIDSLGGADYSVLYTIYSTTSKRWIQFEYVKNALHKSEWLQDQLLINQSIDNYSQLNFFPKRGASCIRFMRRCKEYDTCGLDTATRFGTTFADLPRITSLEGLDKIEKMDYSFKLSELISVQQRKVNNELE